MKKYNIGEWSEIYTFLKLLSDGVIHAADMNLEVLPDIYYPIISIIRKERESELSFNRNSKIKILESSSGEVVLEIPIKKFKDSSIRLLSAIKNTDKTVFSVPEVEKFLKGIRISKIKAPSTEKHDITLIVHDFRTGLKPTLNMSIKSMLGSPSTLLNPGKATNFIYRIEKGNFTEKDSKDVNYIQEGNKIILKMKTIVDTGSVLSFENIESKTFQNNLQMIDSNLPKILAEIIKYRYLFNHKSLRILTEKIEDDDPLNLYGNENLGFYTHKMKALLLAIALGMTPSTKWDGIYSATGGYIIVKPDGDLVIYHIYNINEFQDYLLENTSLDTPSTTRYKYADVYKDGQKFKIKLNLQIRFNS